jgi:hypothetical protein
MKLTYKFSLSLIGLFSFYNASSQQYSQNITVEAFATVLTNPSTIIINWTNDNLGNGYVIYRKSSLSGSFWGKPITNLPATSSQYIDTNLINGVSYEYKIKKILGNGNKGFGYINSSIKLPVIENRGKLILVVENTYEGDNDFDAAINQTITDIVADGWIVNRINVNRNDAVTFVKQLIVSSYNLDPINTKAVYLLGRIPVPYSGFINPDGHPDHEGAWPADVYYGDMNGIWTDLNVNDTSSSRPENHNIPGDGKFDQSKIPSKIELQVGRVDLSGLVSLSDSEKDLLIKYMYRAHNYKTNKMAAIERSLIDDNFTSYQEGFASSGYRNFSVMFGPDQINDSLDYFTGTSINAGASHMWTYGCGGGSFSSCGGIGSTTGFSNDSLQTIFSMLFGSYFGDWDSDDNLLRASIAQGQTLTAAWAGRPHWQFHHMALGSNIGVSTKLTQNNNGQYFSSTYTHYYKRKVHIALMGDPTLRMHYISPPNNLTTHHDNNKTVLNWTPSKDVVLGYNIYRILPGENVYTKINSSPIQPTTFTDNSIIYTPNVIYIVKAVDLKITASGSYFNQSLGTSTTTSIILEMISINNSKMNVYKPY